MLRFVFGSQRRTRDDCGDGRRRRESNKLSGGDSYSATIKSTFTSDLASFSEPQNGIVINKKLSLFELCVSKVCIGSGLNCGRTILKGC